MDLVGTCTLGLNRSALRWCWSGLAALLVACGGGGDGAAVEAGGTGDAAMDLAARGPSPGAPVAAAPPDAPSLSDATAGAADGQTDSAAAPPPRHPQRVNSTLAHAQTDPAIAPLSEGGHVVVWRSAQTDDAAGVSVLLGQRFDDNAMPTGGEFRLDTQGVGAGGGMPAVAGLADGGFIVTWSVPTGTTTLGGMARSGADRLARRFDAAGAPLGDPFRVNDVASPLQHASQVVALAGGGFVIGWPSFEASVPTITILARRYDANGAPVGGATRVSDLDANASPQFALAALPGGGHAAMWAAQGSITRPIAFVWLQRFDAQGGPVGGPVEVNTSVLGSFPLVALSALADGGYAAAWVTAGGGRLVVQRLDATGARLGGEQAVASSEPFAPLLDPRVTALADGGFAVSWRSADPGAATPAWRLRMQRFGQAGDAAGGIGEVAQVPTRDTAAARHGVAPADQRHELAFVWSALDAAHGDDVYLATWLGR